MGSRRTGYLFSVNRYCFVAVVPDGATKLKGLGPPQRMFWATDVHSAPEWPR